MMKTQEPITEQGWIFFRLLLNKYLSSPGEQEELIKLLSEDEKKVLQELPYASKNPNCLLTSPLQKLEYIHYSWLEEEIGKIDEPLRSLIVSALPEHMISSLVKRKIADASLEEKKVQLSDTIRNFLLKTLLSAWKETVALPRELLAQTELMPLLDAPKNDLVELIDLLAMHDLAEEVRHIVDKKLLQSVISKLSIPQQKYLRQTLHQKAKIGALPIQVKELYKDTKKFLYTLHKRGLQRLGYCLSGASPDFIWYITHKLDTGRGKLLMGFIQNEEIATTTQIVRLHVLQILQHIKTKVV